MTGNAKIVIIGLDGVPFGMIKKYAETGVMPHTSRIIQNGFFTPMRSSIPEISSVAWSSIITGANPAEHGIFGFTDLRDHSYKMRFPCFSDLKVRPFWEQCEATSVIVNVPSTYPVRQMNGVHISGFVSIDFEKSVYPESLVPQLRSMDYRLDVDAQKAHTDLNLFLRDLDETLTARTRAIEYLWDYIDWQVFMVAFTGTDRLMHFMWDACEDAGREYHDDFLEHFRKIDRAIGKMLEKTADNDMIVMLSDHGFGKLEKDVYVNYLLARKGFLTFEPNNDPKLSNIARRTKAFALDPGRIYINQKDKYPAGSIETGDKEACLRELEGLFSSLEVDGKKVMKYIYRKEKIYSGPYLENAPDLVLVAEKGFNLKGAMSVQELTAKGPFTGKHTYEDAFLLIRDKDTGAGLGAQPSVIDAGRLIKSLLSGI